MSRIQHQCAKGNNNHWSKEIFHMETTQYTSPVTYKVADAAGEPINGTSYGQELQRVMPLDYFDVKTILNTHRYENSAKYLFKWDSYPHSFNSWESDVVRLGGDSVTPQCPLNHCHGQHCQSGPSSKRSEMMNPTPAVTHSMVFTLPSNASQMLYLENTITDFRLELPEHVVLRGKGYEVALATTTYPARGTMYLTWWGRHTQPPSHFNWDISIHFAAWRRRGH